MEEDKLTVEFPVVVRFPEGSARMSCGRPSDWALEERPAQFERVLSYCASVMSQRVCQGPSTFLDEDGDRVRLDGMDSYLEAFKVARNLGQLVVYTGADPVGSGGGQVPPAWFRREMEKMKADLKNEILSEMGPSRRRARSPAGLAEDSGVKKQRGKKDYISKAWLGGMVAEDSGPSGPVCGQCRASGEPYFVCLDWECRATLCRSCEQGHPTDHAMVRLPRVMREGRRRAADLAHKALLSMPTSRLARKAPKKAGPKWGADVVAEQAPSVEPAGLALVSWLVTNTGKRRWNEKVKLVWVSCSDPGLEPTEQCTVVPALKPGQDGRVQVRLRAPITPGQYSTVWKLGRPDNWFALLEATVAVKGDDQRSETSGVTECRSADLDRDYDLVQDTDDHEGPDSSYVSVAMMDDSTGDLANECRRLSILDRPTDPQPGAQTTPEANEALDSSVGEEQDYSSGETGTVLSSLSSNTYAKLHHLRDTVASNTASAMLTTTQTLAQVGATARALVRANLSAGHPRAWVPKATQTEHAGEYDQQLAQLTQMGFPHSADNLTALRRAAGDINCAVAILLDQ